MQKMRHTRLNSVWVSGFSGEQSYGASLEVQGSSHHPVQDKDSPTPGHHCGCVSMGKGLMPHHEGTSAAVRASQPGGPRNSLRMQSWVQLAALSDLALACLCSQGDTSAAFNFKAD